MQFTVTCYLEKNERMSFNLYGTSLCQVNDVFAQTIAAANRRHDTLESSNGSTIRIASILAYRIVPSN